MAFQKILLDGKPIAAGEEKRLLPSLDVSKWDRLHFHISGGTGSIAGLSVRILFATPMGKVALLANSTVWYEESVSEREFFHITPNTYGGTGFVMSVPVIAPTLYDVILRNLKDSDKPSVWVAVMAQEI